MNQIILIGHLGRDPDLRYTPQGVAVCSFSLATDDSYKDKDGNQISKTDWHKVVAWRGLAENVGKYCKKGSLVAVLGKSKTRAYDDKDGQKKYVTEVVAEQVQFLSKQIESAQEEKREQWQDDLPF